MGRIHRLSPLEAQKIAAGEVVERPANVVKELIENACDAGATQITLHLEDAGKKCIRITDNGCGMDEADAKLSIEQHATSKITSVDDLATITTFGFRGEALASMAAVSAMTLTTKQADAPYALKLTIANSSITNESTCAHNTGTTIEIANLFCNVPARQKFLKKRETEWNNINQFLHAFCLSHYDINLTVTHDSATALHNPAVNALKDRCLQLWGSHVANSLITIEGSHPSRSLSIRGIVSNHQQARYDRSGIFFFVNNRWIKNSTLARALLNAYQNVLPSGRYPLAALFITIDTHEIDVNIHPRKEEVQFLHPRIVENLIQDTVKQALEDNLSSALKKPIALAAGILPDGSIQRISHFKPSAPVHYQPLPANFIPVQPAQQHDIPSNFLHDPFPVPETLPQEQKALDEQTPLCNTALEQHGTLIGQYAKTYILVESEDGLWVFDQHAVHERILYEQFAQRFQDIATVQLIVPHVVTLARDQLTLLAPHVDLIRLNGFVIDVVSEDQLVISATPVHAKNLSLDEFIRQCIGWITEYQSYDAHQCATTINHHMRAQMACKAAVKAGDELSREAMQELLDTLQKMPNKLTCPHGRPTGWLMNVYELEKKFKRKV